MLPYSLHRCSQSEIQKEAGSVSIPASPEIVHGKQIIIPSFPIPSDTESDTNSRDEEEDEDNDQADHKISNTDTIIHMLKVRSVSPLFSADNDVPGKHWDGDTRHA